MECQGCEVPGLGERAGLQYTVVGVERRGVEEVVVTVHVGDRIIIESERASQSGRAGLVEEVLSERPQRLRVRWDDGRTSTIAPAAGVAIVEPAARPRKRKAIA